MLGMKEKRRREEAIEGRKLLLYHFLSARRLILGKVETGG